MGDWGLERARRLAGGILVMRGLLIGDGAGQGSGRGVVCVCVG